MEPNQDPKKQKIEKTKEASMKTLAVFGLIAILALLSIGIVKFAPGAIRAIAAAAVSLSSVFIPADNLAIEATKYNVSSGEPFTLRWTRENSDETSGSYTLSYPCQDGVHLEAVQPGNNDVVFCNTSYHFLNSGDTLTLMGFINPQNQNQTVDIPVTIHFTQNGSSRETTSGTITISVSNTPFSPVNTGSTGSQTGTPVGTTTGSTNTGSTGSAGSTGQTTPQPGTTPGQSTSNRYPLPGTTVYQNNPNGQADLTARILEIGTISTTTGAFIPKREVGTYDRGAIRFEVINVGNKTSDSWTFAAVLPTFPDYIFQSESQQPLRPGDRIEFTIGFDSVKRQAQSEFRINVDPIGSVKESNKDNNIIKGTFYVNLGN